MDVHDGEYVSFAVTAPGREVLGHPVDGAKLDRWMMDAPERWRNLHSAAQLRCVREFGRRAFIICRVWEPQRRGAPHAHVSVSARTELEKIIARRYGQHLAELAESHGFGFVLGYGLTNEKVYANGRSAARYLAGYFIGGHGSKPSLTDAARLGVLPQRSVWISSALTRVSGINMRNLRLARQVWAYRRGFRACPRDWALVGADYEDHPVWKLLGGHYGMAKARAQRAALNPG